MKKIKIAIFCYSRCCIVNNGNFVLLFVNDKGSHEMDVTKFKVGNEVY